MALGAVRAGLGRVGGIGLLARTQRICICWGVLLRGHVTAPELPRVELSSTGKRHVKHE